MHVIRRIEDVRRAVALETTLLAHGVPRESAPALHDRVAAAVRQGGGEPALIGVVNGHAMAGMTRNELDAMLAAREVPKANSANLGLMLCGGGQTATASFAATTISTTVEVAAAVGVSFMATGGLGGVHKGYGAQFDISSDLAAIARHPVAVVCSGVKGILDVAATREVLESLGVPVVGFGTWAFPAFYQREAIGANGRPVGVDARFDDTGELSRFVRRELARTGRGIVVCHPVPQEFEIAAPQWGAWLKQAEDLAAAEGARGRDVTPIVLAALHRVSGGATLRTNIELVVSNAGLAGRLAGP